MDYLYIDCICTDQTPMSICMKLFKIEWSAGPAFHLRTRYLTQALDNIGLRDLNRAYKS